MTEIKPTKPKSKPDLAYGVRRAPGGWRAYEARLVEGRCTSTTWLCEVSTLGEALSYMRRALRVDWAAYYS